MSLKHREIIEALRSIFRSKNITLAAAWRRSWLGFWEKVNISRPFRRHQPREKSDGLGCADGGGEK